VAELRIETRTEGQAAVLELFGEFDLAGIEQFETDLGRIESGGAKVLVVDLSGLDFMDSSGLRALVMADQRAAKDGRRLAIVPGPPAVRRVFEITQLDSRLDLVESPTAL
jgi:anti-sigma B factor antagonist